ncbi:hypothetical protein TH61_16285 [Rufibacter sp. DG15C]|uniref:hypothetical protein n=1 Tax=Rufibacter sp. DG15C TaxID=1379909 RepID=UPI00078E5F63|nr:hypothetical protein [Rufibacter sp. DG15C]AMM52435.1 hypothetical protein TH61_16285 [Rufibacter sp. DG15C]
MKNFIPYTILLAFLLNSYESTAQQAFIKEGRELIDKGHYKDAIKLLDANWRVAINKLEVDLLIAVCYCNLGKYDEGVSEFNNIKSRYINLNKNTQYYISESINKCRPGEVSPSKPIQALAVIASVRWSAGKEFYFPSDHIKYNKNPSTVKIVQTRVNEELIPYTWSNELTKIKVQNTINKINYKNKYKINSYYISKNFIVYNFVSNNNSKTIELAKELERNLVFYSNYYKMTIPPYKINAFIVKSQAQLNDIALRHHGISLNPNNIGYSVTNDLSILSYAPNQTTGTLNHELIHLLLNFNYPFLKPWVNEGLASLYESNEWKDNKVIGLPNWRGDVIRDNLYEEEKEVIRGDILKNRYEDTYGWNFLDNLINMDSNEFNRHPLLNHAMARYFCLYLQDKGLLQPLFNEYNKIYFANTGTLSSSYKSVKHDDMEILFKISNGLTMFNYQYDFRKWLHSGIGDLEY